MIEPVSGRPSTGTVREITESLLRDCGMTTVFGNPGSTELRFLRDWPADFRYVMALHEGCAVAAADAFAQLTGNAALVSLHSAGGVGNAMGAVYTAYRNNAPLVILAGQQTRAMLPSEPFLFARDAATLPQPYVKWAIEPARAADVPLALARAYAIAMQRPYGPTFVSVPEDDWDAPAAAVTVRRVAGDFGADPTALAALAAALDAARSPAFVVGSGVDRDGAAELVVRLAERLGATVWASALTSRCSFPEAHPLFAGALPRTRDLVVERLRPHDLVVALGAPIFNYHVHSEGPHVAPGTTVFQLTDDPNAASYAAAGTSIITSLRPAVEQLVGQVAPRAPALAVPRQRAAAAATDPIGIDFLLQTLAQTMPPDAIVVEEAPSTHAVLHDHLPLRPGAYLTAGSGSLGFGAPAAVGAALAAPGRRVVALIGDGSLHYGIQALWNAAQLRLPVTYVIVNNGGYGAMRSFTELLGLHGAPSFAIGAVDLTALAAGYGVAGSRVTSAAELPAALRGSFAAGSPSLIDVIVDSAPQRLY